MKQEVREAPTLAQAQQRLQEIQTKRAHLGSHQASLNAQIELAQKEVGREYLTGKRDGLRRVVELRVETEAVQSALQTLAVDESAAEMEVERARVADLREQAKQKASELEKLNQETAKLLAELSKLEGVPFTTSILSSQPILGSRGMMGDPLTPNAPDPWLGICELRVNNPSGHLAHGPKSRGLREEIRKLEAEAVSIEQKLIPRATRSSAAPNPAEAAQLVAPQPGVRNGALPN
jgi:hypothetical protein